MERPEKEGKKTLRGANKEGDYKVGTLNGQSR